MRILLTGALILTGWLGIGAYWHTCHIRMLCDDCKTSEPKENTLGPNNNTNPEESNPKEQPWSIQGPEGNEIMLFSGTTEVHRGMDGIRFKKGAEGFQDSVYQYLLHHPDHYVELTGYHHPKEMRGTGHQHLGMARAEELKRLLVKRGVNGDRVVTKGATNSDFKFSSKGKYSGALDVKFGVMDESQELEVESHIAEKTLYCEFAQAEFLPDPSLVNYATELKNYLVKYNQKKVYLTGHTDSEGSEATNRSVGKKRARQVMNYFLTQGIEKGKMKSSSKGETKPIADNSTEEGRAKNRRIEIVVK